jgi:hypothetical protein
MFHYYWRASFWRFSFTKCDGSRMKLLVKEKVMEGERVIFKEESQRGQYLKLIASGDVDHTLLDALENFLKRQRKRRVATPGDQP